MFIRRLQVECFLRKQASDVSGQNIIKLPPQMFILLISIVALQISTSGNEWRRNAWGRERVLFGRVSDAQGPDISCASTTTLLVNFLALILLQTSLTDHDLRFLIHHNLIIFSTLIWLGNSPFPCFHIIFSFVCFFARSFDLSLVRLRPVRIICWPSLISV